MKTSRRNFVGIVSSFFAASTSNGVLASDERTATAPEILDINKSPLIPWDNGKGKRRELALQPMDGSPSSGFAWRMGVAYVTADAPFSPMSGVDRWITLVDGDGFDMESSDFGTPYRLSKPLSPFGFRGESPITAKVLGSETQVFNVMVRRGVFNAQVEKLTASTLPPWSSLLLVYCTHGELGVDVSGKSKHTLTPGQGALWRHGSPTLRVSMKDVSSGGLVIRIWPDR
jgi:environmental stress-induced protein Ves